MKMAYVKLDEEYKKNSPINWGKKKGIRYKKSKYAIKEKKGWF